MVRPLLYVDVDGPLNPFAAGRVVPEGFTVHRMRPDGWVAWLAAQPPGAPGSRAKELRVLLSAAVGARLAALSQWFDPVWATAWRNEANTHIAPLIGLPPWPVVEWPGGPGVRPPVGQLHWKTQALVEHAGGRPFAWVDDEVSMLDGTWVAENHGGPALVRKIDPVTGLEAADFEALEGFARNLPPC